MENSLHRTSGVLVCIHIDIDDTAIRKQYIAFFVSLFSNLDGATTYRNGGTIPISRNSSSCSDIDISLTVYGDMCPCTIEERLIFYIQTFDSAITIGLQGQISMNGDFGSLINRLDSISRRSLIITMCIDYNVFGSDIHFPRFDGHARTIIRIASTIFTNNQFASGYFRCTIRCLVENRSHICGITALGFQCECIFARIDSEWCLGHIYSGLSICIDGCICTKDIISIFDIVSIFCICFRIPGQSHCELRLRFRF